MLKEDTIVTFFPTNTRWMDSWIPIGCMEDPALVINLIQKNTVIPQDKWLDARTLREVSHLLPDEIMPYVMSKWDSALYSHRQLFLDPPEEFNLGVIDRWWVESQEQDHMNSDPSIMLSERSMIRIAAQVSNLVEDHNKMPKTLEQWCPLAFNLIMLYKPPYLDNQAHIESYLGQATICPTMESM